MGREVFRMKPKLKNYPPWKNIAREKWRLEDIFLLERPPDRIYVSFTEVSPSKSSCLSPVQSHNRHLFVDKCIPVVLDSGNFSVDTQRYYTANFGGFTRWIQKNSSIIDINKYTSINRDQWIDSESTISKVVVMDICCFQQIFQKHSSRDILQVSLDINRHEHTSTDPINKYKTKYGADWGLQPYSKI